MIRRDPFNMLESKYGKEFPDWAKRNKDKVIDAWLNAGCKTEKEYKDKCDWKTQRIPKERAQWRMCVTIHKNEIIRGREFRRRVSIDICKNHLPEFEKYELTYELGKLKESCVI